MTFKPSPTPWSLSKSGDGIWQIRSGDDYVGSCMYSDDMRHIVTAVNAYDKQRALIETLQIALEKLTRDAGEVSRLGAVTGHQWTLLGGALVAARAALAAAKEQSA